MRNFSIYTTAEDYLNYRYSPADKFFHYLTDCWFINGNKNSFKVRFMYEHIADEILIAPMLNNEWQTDLNTNLFGNWDCLFVEIFNVRFAVLRDDNSFVIRFMDGYDITDFKILKTSSETAPHKLFSSSVQISDTTFIQIHNRELQVITPRNMCESVSCRTAILYMLAQAYIKRMQSSLDNLITLGKTPRRSYGGGFLKRNIPIDDLFQDATEFKIRFILDMPLKINRVEDTARIWSLIYQYYNVKQYILDLDSKMKDVKLLLDNKCMNHIAITGNRISYFAAIFGLLGVLGTWLPIFRN